MSSIGKPKIAVTGPDDSGTTAWLFSAFNVWLSGGKAYRVTPKQFDGNTDYDGFIIGGGSDIHPDNYQQQDLPAFKRPLSLKLKEWLVYPLEFLDRFSKGRYDKPRDDMEIAFIDHALQQGKPILAICRGYQLLNARLGGKMYTSTLPLLRREMRIRSFFPRKKVIYTQDDSLISKIAGDEPLRVNALHSQAVAQPGDNMQVTGKEKSGINQVTESTKSDKILGVQWHPEYLFYMKAHRNIFDWLVCEARAKGSKKSC
ncbi:gamma-glutamyl-gamma-aminobutyrate hydrolase family protein [Pseudoalteromonas byunsanensis]|uniref:Uncharacterized protein n=1 Tax=Pseudoalteromonas byunsanensis TaxID=327939 RepID=A0A1S1N2V7_9GAMM|nr:gamma-glutamyl-gamma-aminobutyrate hydrolase family protein [Pseudoalteromonas byunsanensis]OHU93720.1 hypothetical protein BIW53_19460 [Pseudoalteromonas byunsanensis]